MTARRIAVYAVLLIIAVLILLFVLAPLPARAQNFRSADQVRLLSVIHITSPWATLTDDLWITNKSADPVSVSVTYGAANGAPNEITFRDAIKLAPFQQCEFIDFLGAATSPSPQCKVIGAPLTTSGFGQVMFNACLDGADCGWDVSKLGGGCGGPGQRACTPVDFEPPEIITRNYRSISVTSRIYSSVPTATAGPCPNGCPPMASVGQDFPAVPWWSYGDAYSPVTITGVRNLKDVWHTNLGIVNASNTQPVTIIATLYDGASHGQRDQVTFDLPPFGARQQGATDLFPLFGEWARQNPTRMAANAYITITAAKAANGWVGFFAYGSLIDSRSGSAMTLEPTFDGALDDGQIDSLFGVGRPPRPVSAFKTAALATPRAERINDVLHLTFRGARCSIEPGGAPGDYRVRRLDGAEWFHVNVAEWNKARAMCEMGQRTEAQ